jgi:hypothetical protein
MNILIFLKYKTVYNAPMFIIVKCMTNKSYYFFFFGDLRQTTKLILLLIFKKTDIFIFYQFKNCKIYEKEKKAKKNLQSYLKKG